MKIGIIGAGNIAGTMATTLQQLKGTECYAIASRDITRARAFADKYGFEKAYGSYSDMLSDPYVELVYIATPHSHHYDHIKMCLNHGKHVLCEKAFCANAAQAEEVLYMARERGLLLAEAMWTRYMPMRALINKVLKSGIIGNPTSLSANLGYPLISKSRLVRPELAGGALLDLGVYVLNFASMVFGDAIDSVAANCVKLDSGVDAQENIMLTYKDGKMASLYATMLAQTDRRGLINGTNGYIEIENINNYEIVRVFNLERKIVAEYTAPTQITGYEYEVQSVMRAIREGKIECPEMPHTEILRMMQLMDSIRSAWGIVFPFERDNTIRVSAGDEPVRKIKKIKKQKSVVRKISEKSVSDTEYENTVKPKARNAKDAREMLPESPHKGITDKLPHEDEFAKTGIKEASPIVPKKLKDTPVLKKPDDDEKIIEAELKKHEKVLDKERERVELEEKRLAEEQARREAEEAERKRREEEELKKRPAKKEKSPTEKLFELGLELSVHEERPAGSVTDQIRGLTLEEEIPASPGGVTDKLQKIDVPDNPVDPAFQRRRGAPVASVKSWNSSDVN